MADALSRRGVDETVIQGVLGHSCIESQSLYSDLDLAAFDEAHERLFSGKSPKF